MIRLGRSVLVLVVSATAFLTGSTAYADQDHAPSTPIEHFIVLMQENHSFDNYFGTYPGADGFPDDTCIPIDPDEQSGECVEPFHLGDLPVLDLPHSRDAFDAQYRSGTMDGFISATNNPSSDIYATMGYYDYRDLPYYWNIADEYVLFDRLFESAAAGSVLNHMFWVTGSDGGSGDSIPDEGYPETLPTIFDRLEEAGVSWKFYIQNYDPEITFRTRFEVAPNRSAQVIWAPVLAFDRFIDDPDLSGHIVDMEQYFVDLNEGTLPEVAYMVPSGSSEHPPGSLQAGERMVRNLINSLMRSDYWDSSAFMWTYDDWGGFYDHVPPPQVDEFGYGFRVPALLVSAYARRGHIESTELDFTSVLKFIEQNWSIEPLAQRDAEANSILGAFDFESPPREPRILPSERYAPLEDAKPATAVFAIYGASALAVLAMGGVAARRFSMSTRTRRRR
jgi:phospholipase C